MPFAESPRINRGLSRNMGATLPQTSPRCPPFIPTAAPDDKAALNK